MNNPTLRGLANACIGILAAIGVFFIGVFIIPQTYRNIIEQNALTAVEKLNESLPEYVIDYQVKLQPVNAILATDENIVANYLVAERSDLIDFQLAYGEFIRKQSTEVKFTVCIYTHNGVLERQIGQGLQTSAPDCFHRWY